MSVYTNDASLVAASVPSVYVIVGSLLIGSVANVAFNGVSGTGNTRSAPFYGSGGIDSVCAFCICRGDAFTFAGSRMLLDRAIYYSGLLVASVIYLKKASWQNKRI